jgi:ABC-type nitrate/sulfonate/bicarbonate transport system substrate-binding protein
MKVKGYGGLDVASPQPDTHQHIQARFVTMHLPLLLLSSCLLCGHLIISLKIATSLSWVEHTQQPYAIAHFYNGSTPATLSSGGVANLASDKSFDLAANAETQGLKVYASNRNIRLIYVICEVAYRIVADKRKGIKELKDLKGKKIGSFKGSSASVFVHNMLSSVGVEGSEYTVTGGDVCMEAPCGDKTLPQMLVKGQLDAFGIWQPAVELGARALGDNAITFQNASIYRKVYALYSTTDALNNLAKRKDIVEFVRALNRTLDVFANQPKEKGVYDFVAGKVGSDAGLVEAIWRDHKWSGRWDGGLLEFLVEEDKYLAGEDKRAITPRKELAYFLDPSVFVEL